MAGSVSGNYCSGPADSLLLILSGVHGHGRPEAGPGVIYEAGEESALKGAMSSRGPAQPDSQAGNNEGGGAAVPHPTPFSQSPTRPPTSPFVSGSAASASQPVTKYGPELKKEGRISRSSWRAKRKAFYV